jgi:hypothetical protein
MKKYEYMIVYSSHNGGIGRNSLTSINKLNSYTFLEEIDQLLHEKEGEDVFIIYYKLLRVIEVDLDERLNK